MTELITAERFLYVLLFLALDKIAIIGIESRTC